MDDYARLAATRFVAAAAYFADDWISNPSVLFGPVENVVRSYQEKADLPIPYGMAHRAYVRLSSKLCSDAAWPLSDEATRILLAVSGCLVAGVPSAWPEYFISWVSQDSEFAVRSATAGITRIMHVQKCDDGRFVGRMARSARDLDRDGNPVNAASFNDAKRELFGKLIDARVGPSLFDFLKLGDPARPAIFVRKDEADSGYCRQQVEAYKAGAWVAVSRSSDDRQWLAIAPPAYNSIPARLKPSWHSRKTAHFQLETAGIALLASILHVLPVNVRFYVLYLARQRYPRFFRHMMGGELVAKQDIDRSKMGPIENLDVMKVLFDLPPSRLGLRIVAVARHWSSHPAGYMGVSSDDILLLELDSRAPSLDRYSIDPGVELRFECVVVQAHRIICRLPASWKDFMSMPDRERRLMAADAFERSEGIGARCPV